MRADSTVSDGDEILVCDPKRRPPDWAKIVQLHQCAVFLRDAKLGVLAGRDGSPRSKSRATCITFDSVDQAERFCRILIESHRKFRVKSTILWAPPIHR